MTVRMLLRIHDAQPMDVLAVDLRHVLDLLGTRAAHSQWRVSGVAEYGEAVMIAGGEAADRLEELSGSNQKVAGDVLQRLSQQVDQVIWGEFSAFEPPDQRAWLVIRAIDSTWYEVETEDERVIEAIRDAFGDIREIA